MRNYNELTVPHLRSICQDHGLRVSGKKKDLVERLVLDYIKRFKSEYGTREELELEIQNAESEGNPDVVKLKEKLAVYNETMEWAYEQLDLVYLLDINRIERYISRKKRELEAIQEAMRMLDKKNVRRIPHKACNALTPTDL
jgi:hypothetical protein